MGNSSKRQITPEWWALRVTLWLGVLVSVPAYLWFLHEAGDRWGQLMAPEDDLRFWLPIVVPGAAFSFTLLSCLSWWWSTEDYTFLLGRRGWRFLMVFVVALSLIAGYFGSQNQDLAAVVLTAGVTALGITGLWLLPAALSPRLLDRLRREPARSADPA